MKYFSIPGYFRHFDQIVALNEFKKEHPDYFEPDRIIESAYDFPSHLIWNGGRFDTYIFNPFTQREMLEYYFVETNMKLAHTCTNMLIDSTLAKDWSCNLFLEKFYRPQDIVIISSFDLYEHLKNAFNNMNFILSTTAGITDIKDVNRIINDYNMSVVIDYHYNNNDEYLKQIQRPEKVELICAEPCEFTCNHRKQHYQEISQTQLGLIEYGKDGFAACPYKTNVEKRVFAEIQKLPQAITNERIDELADVGINHFKISGRPLVFTQWYETMTYYLVKPKYQQYVAQTLIQQEV